MAKPTINPVILRHHIQHDGTCPVKIRITHYRKSRYLATTVTAQKGEYDKSLHLKSSVITRLNPILKDLESIISSKTTFEWGVLDISEATSYIESSLTPEKKFTLDFFQWGDYVASTKPKFSGANYRTALSSFEKFLGSRELDITLVTSTLMRRFEAYLINKHGKDARAVSLYTSALATIHKEARKRYNDNELGKVKILNPFEYYTPPKQKPAKKRTLEPGVIQQLIDIRNSLGEMHKLAVDIFLLSFVTMGTNIPDLYYAEIEGDVIYYNRTKTKDRRHDDAEMRIRLEPVCSDLINGLRDFSGERAFRLHRQYSFYKSIADKGNDRLKDVAKMLDIKPFTMYAARHTWASTAYSIGIPKSLINDCLCHVDPDRIVTDIYIKKDWSVLWEANKKVLEQFDWK